MRITRSIESLPNPERSAGVDERTFIQRDEKGGIHLQGIILDITEHKRAEEALQQMEDIRKKEIHHRIKNNLTGNFNPAVPGIRELFR